jgi:hypothetical protein
MTAKRIVRMLAAALLPTLLAACVAPPGEQRPEPTEPPDSMEGLAPVDQVRLRMMTSFPLQVSVDVKGHLPDGCTEIDEVKTTYDEQAKTFDVAITTWREDREACTQQAVLFEEAIPLDVYGLPAGTYTVNVNGVSDTFTFRSDNTLSGTAPGRDTRVNWGEARELILIGQVETVTQLRGLELRLRLEDGREMLTRQPGRHAVFDVVNQCGDRCEAMRLTSEQ